MEKKANYTMEDLLLQIDETLKIIQNHEGPIKLTPELIADIHKLETTVTHFKETSEELFKIADIDIEEVKREFLESTEVRSNDKQLIKRAEDIEQNARVMRLALSKARGKGRKKVDKQQIRERRKLFKSIGGDKTWLPL